MRTPYSAGDSRAEHAREVHDDEADAASDCARTYEAREIVERGVFGPIRRWGVFQVNGPAFSLYLTDRDKAEQIACELSDGAESPSWFPMVTLWKPTTSAAMLEAELPVKEGAA